MVCTTVEYSRSTQRGEEIFSCHSALFYRCSASRGKNFRAALRLENSQHLTNDVDKGEQSHRDAYIVQSFQQAYV